MTSKSSIGPDQLQRVCRMYYTNQDAMRALGLHNNFYFKTLCYKYGLEPPSDRKKRLTCANMG